jgi:hypothetical protein
MGKTLTHFVRIVLGVILGTFLYGVPLSLLMKPTYSVAVVSGVLGVISFYSYLIYTNAKNNKARK